MGGIVGERLKHPGKGTASKKKMGFAMFKGERISESSGNPIHPKVNKSFFALCWDHGCVVVCNVESLSAPFRIQMFNLSPSLAASPRFQSLRSLRLQSIRC